MLPSIRQNEYHYDIPKLNLVRDDIEDFIPTLKTFHKNFENCFHRSELRGHFFKYMVGQFSGLERKSIEPIALHVEGGKVRAMQRFISEAEWDDSKIMAQYHSLVVENLGSPDGALVFDETGFVKKGNNSVGVARQYCGSVGKVENSQVGVFAAYVSSLGYSLVDKRLYLPEKWFTEEYEERRKKCNLPECIEFKTKPQLAVDMLNDIVKVGIIPFKYVLADSIYGENPGFIDAVTALTDVTYFVSIGSNTLCWLKKPLSIEKTYKYRGNLKTKKKLVADEKNPISVKELAQNTNDHFWYRRTVSEGSKGPIVYEFTRRRIYLSKKGLPQKCVWLIIKRTLEDDPEYSYYISNASTSSRLPLFVWLSGLRWGVEQCFEETKSELGMDHYEVRKFRGWHHHILVCMLSHFFLWYLKIKLKKKSTVHYFIPD